MAKPNNTSRSRSNDPTFINLELTREDEVRLKGAKFAQTNWYAHINDIVYAAYKLTLKQYTKNNVGMVMIQHADYDPTEPNVFWIMRGSSVASALLKTAFYWCISEGQLPDPQAIKSTQPSDDDLFG